MRINIDTKNSAKINAELEKLNGKAESFTITTTDEVVKIAAKAEKQLEALPKAMRKGAVVYFTPAGPTARSYKYAVKTTKLSMQRGASGWFLTGISTVHVSPTRSEHMMIKISKAQAEEIQRRAIETFTVVA